MRAVSCWSIASTWHYPALIDPEKPPRQKGRKLALLYFSGINMMRFKFERVGFPLRLPQTKEAPELNGRVVQ
jgi:hypothetical protein